MDQLLANAGPWFWWAAAGALLILELALPGVFFIWLGLAAVVTGAVHAAFAPGWNIELTLFAILSVVFLFAGRQFLASRKALQSDKPNLNRRTHGYIGQIATLESAIENGKGKVRIDDTLWEAMGADLPKGARVKVTGVEGLRLKVEAA
jgi:inner membrane protein